MMLEEKKVGTTCENFVVKDKSNIPKDIKKHGVKTAIIALKTKPI